VRAFRSPEVQARPILPHTDAAGEKERRCGFPPSSSSRCGILWRSAEFSSSTGTDCVMCSLCTSRMRSEGGFLKASLCLSHSLMICLVTRRCMGNEGRASASPFSTSCRARKEARRLRGGRERGRTLSSSSGSPGAGALAFGGGTHSLQL
jgi:hypothetical protein